jgi:hypothetical protein
MLCTNRVNVLFIQLACRIVVSYVSMNSMAFQIEELRLQIPEVGVEAEKSTEAANLDLPSTVDTYSAPASVEFVDGFYLLTQ